MDNKPVYFLFTANNVWDSKTKWVVNLNMLFISATFGCVIADEKELQPLQLSVSIIITKILDCYTKTAECFKLKSKPLKI